MYNKNVWTSYSEEELNKLMAFAEGYKKFISKGKTERECVKLATIEAEAKDLKTLKMLNLLKLVIRFTRQIKERISLYLLSVIKMLKKD